MIIYHPTSGNVHNFPVRLKPQACFLMTKLGKAVPTEVTAARADIKRVLDARGFKLLDATSQRTGKDFLVNIWDQMVAVPMGIAIVYPEMPCSTFGNVFYELGLMAALGKETLVVRIRETEMPSDFARTEWIEYDECFEETLNEYLESLGDRAEFFGVVADQLEKEPLLAIDYCRRAYVITGDTTYKEKARAILADSGLDKRPRDSLEMLHASFCR